MSQLAIIQGRYGYHCPHCAGPLVTADEFQELTNSAPPAAEDDEASSEPSDRMSEDDDDEENPDSGPRTWEEENPDAGAPS